MDKQIVRHILAGNNVIPFNKPYLAGKELDYIKEAMESGKISGNGNFTRKCCDFFETRYGFQKMSFNNFLH